MAPYDLAQSSSAALSCAVNLTLTIQTQYKLSFVATSGNAYGISIFRMRSYEIMAKLNMCQQQKSGLKYRDHFSSGGQSSQSVPKLGFLREIQLDKIRSITLCQSMSIFVKLSMKSKSLGPRSQRLIAPLLYQLVNGHLASQAHLCKKH